MEIIKYFASYVAGTDEEGFSKELRLSSMVKNSSKKEVHKHLFDLFKQTFSMIRVKREMTVTEIFMFVTVFYKNYHWMSLGQVFDFLEKLITADLGKLYGKLDIHTLMEKLAEYDTKNNLERWGNKELEGKKEYKLLEKGKPNFVPMPDSLKKLYTSMKIERHLDKDKKKLSPRKKMWNHFRHNCGLSEEAAKKMMVDIFNMWKEEMKDGDKWEEHRDKRINKLLYDAKHEWRSRMKV